MSLSRVAKHRISMEIVATLNKIKYYNSCIDAIKKDNSSFYDCNVEMRLKGIRNNVWLSLTVAESLTLLRKRISEAKKQLTALETRIK